MTTPARRRSRDAITGVLLLLVALGFVYVRQVQAHQNDALHSIICRAEYLVETHPGLSPAKRREELRFYEDVSAGAHLKPCNNQEGSQ